MPCSCIVISHCYYGTKRIKSCTNFWNDMGKTKISRKNCRLYSNSINSCPVWRKYVPSLLYFLESLILKPAVRVYRWHPFRLWIHLIAFWSVLEPVSKHFLTYRNKFSSNIFDFEIHLYDLIIWALKLDDVVITSSLIVHTFQIRH